MKTGKQILKEFLDAKAKSAVPAPNEDAKADKEAKDARAALNAKFFEAIANNFNLFAR